MKRIYKGKYRLRVAREYPCYVTKGRTLCKVLFDRFGISISLWVYHNEVYPQYNEWARKKIYKIFPGAEIDNHSNVHWCGEVYYRDCVRWMLSNKLDLTPTESPQVMFDKKTQKYIGFSHRGRESFGIGDMLFQAEPSREEKTMYYKNRKYRRKFLLALWEYHIKGNWYMFEDLCEDEIIGHGITNIIPFKERGSKRIETREEAFTAAKNLAEYIS